MSKPEDPKGQTKGPNPMLKELIKNLGLSTREEALAKAIHELTDEQKIEMLSNLNPYEDDELAMISLIGERYDAEFLKEYVATKLVLRCSVQGWRAGQITNIASEIRKDQKGNILSRIFHRGENSQERELG